MVKQKPKVPKVCTRREVKLKLTQEQEALLDQWLWHMTAVFNWGLRTIELNAANKIYFSKFDFMNLLKGTPQKLDIPSQIIQGVLERAWLSWDRCFNKTSKKPRLKGIRRPLTSLNFPADCEIPEPGCLKIRGFMGGARSRPALRYKQQHAQAKHDPARGDMIDAIPKEALGSVLLKKRASGWHASILVRQAPREIARSSSGIVGIDPGFETLLTLSTGEKIEHPQEFQELSSRISQAQRGQNRRLTTKLQEKLSRQVRDRNHKLSRRLVSENIQICYSNDNLLSLAAKKTKFGKSVRAAAHGQLRDMIRSKSSKGGTEFILVDNNKSTMTCSVCGRLSGPRGKAGLQVRQWTCLSCGTHHDRDINAAVNTFIAGAGQAHEQKAGIIADYLKLTSQALCLANTSKPTLIGEGGLATSTLLGRKPMIGLDGRCQDLDRAMPDLVW